jgi:hypothetical protein
MGIAYWSGCIIWCNSMGFYAGTGASNQFGGGSNRAGGKGNSGEGSSQRATVGSQSDADQSGGGQPESTAGDVEINGREAGSVDPDNVTEAVRLDYDPENPDRFCDLREWNKLKLVNPPAKRHEVAKDWLKFNYQQCGYGAMIYVRNSMPRVLGTAHQVDVDVLTWELVAPQAERTQAIKKKRRL